MPYRVALLLIGAAILSGACEEGLTPVPLPPDQFTMTALRMTIVDAGSWSYRFIAHRAHGDDRCIHMEGISMNATPAADASELSAYQLTVPHGVVHPASGNARMQGGVRVRFANGITLATATARLEGSSLLCNSAITVSGPEITVELDGARINMGSMLLTSSGPVRGTLSPDARP